MKYAFIHLLSNGNVSIEGDVFLGFEDEEIYGGSGYEKNKEVFPSLRENKWELYSSKKKRNSRPNVKPIIGTKKSEEANVCKLKAIGKRSWIFISRLSPEVQKEDLVSYLEGAGVNNSECVELKTKVPNTTDIDRFLLLFDDLLQTASHVNHEVIICADFNINFLETKDRNTVAFSNLVGGYGLNIMLNNSITRPGNINRGTCIDNIVTSVHPDRWTVKVVPTVESDHFAMSTSMELSTVSEEGRTTSLTRRNRTTCDAVRAFLQACLDGMEKGLCVESRFFDLSKAFDTVQHESLLIGADIGMSQSWRCSAVVFEGALNGSHWLPVFAKPCGRANLFQNIDLCGSVGEKSIVVQ
ncbi:hypothetical protein J6590_006773 [Homalodisca vitripennis]|nr:hypothetical protein J6590_006773 [Homalodisca vitripennis]